jgi:hypothetical protein
MGRAEPPESARDVSNVSKLPACSHDWSRESGTRPRVELESLVDDTHEVITAVEPWSLRARALRPRPR